MKCSILGLTLFLYVSGCTYSKYHGNSDSIEMSKDIGAFISELILEPIDSNTVTDLTGQPLHFWCEYRTTRRQNIFGNYTYSKHDQVQLYIKFAEYEALTFDRSVIKNVRLVNLQGKNIVNPHYSFSPSLGYVFTFDEQYLERPLFVVLRAQSESPQRYRVGFT